MTNEEKAEEYKKNYNRYLKIAKKIKNADDRFFIVDFLLKEGRKNAEKENTELKKELRQKSDTNHFLVEQLADKEIIISELKEQIEKVKTEKYFYKKDTQAT